MSGRTVVLVLCAFLAVRAVTLPLLPLTDDTEARYGMVAKDMADRGDWVTPWVWIDGRHIPFLGKPPLHFWASALCVRLLGATEFALRLPSLLGAVVLIALMRVVLRRHTEPDTADMAVLILCSCLLFFTMAGIVMIDMTLALCVAGAVFAYQAFLLESRVACRRLWSLAVFVLLGLGFLTKGPIAVVMFGIPVFVRTLLSRGWAGLREHVWWAGIPLFLAIVVPWFWLAEIRNPGFLDYFFIHENVLRFVSHDYGDVYGKGHSAPYGTAAVMLLATGAPWTLWCAVLAVRCRGREWVRASFRDERVGLFSMALVGMTLFLCLFRQILPTYLLPVLPFFAVWAARLFQASGVRKATVIRVALVSVFLYGIAYPLGRRQVELRFTSKAVIRMARDLSSKQSLDGQLVFVRKTPYSAYFYGFDMIVPHPAEAVAVSISRALKPGARRLLALNRKDEKKVTPDLLAKLERVGACGVWTLYRAAP